jgi:hypothetical protein
MPQGRGSLSCVPLNWLLLAAAGFGSSSCSAVQHHQCIRASVNTHISTMPSTLSSPYLPYINPMSALFQTLN